MIDENRKEFSKGDLVKCWFFGYTEEDSCLGIIVAINYSNCSSAMAKIYWLETMTCGWWSLKHLHVELLSGINDHAIQETSAETRRNKNV